MSNWIEQNFIELKGFPYLEGFVSEKNGLFLNLTFYDDDEKKIVVHFKDYLFYRTMNESYGLNQIPSEGFYANRQICSTDTSDLIDWFNEESSNIYKGSFRHYGIPSGEEIIEVLSKSPPKLSQIFHEKHLDITLNNMDIWS